MLDSHVHFAHIVAPLVDCLDEKFLEEHFAMDDVFDCRESGVDRAVARCACFELLSGNVKPDTCHRVYFDA